MLRTIVGRIIEQLDKSKYERSIMFEFLFLDLDDTILDFHKAEHIAIRKTLTEFGMDPTDQVCDLYSRINLAHWEALERKEITRQRLMWSRFQELFDQLGVTGDPKLCGRRYMENLGQGHYFIPGAAEAVERLSKKYKLYLASNGTTQVQKSRLESAGIGKFFQEIFISQQIGVDKPDKLYFQRCFARIPDFDPAKTMIVGDSLTSDIQGGKNAGITTCWINPTHKSAPPHINPDYQLESITQLESLLEEL